MVIRIALVDDHQPFREAMREKLARDPEFDVIWQAANGFGALNMAAQSPPDTLFLDISLPDMSGMDVARRLNADTPSVKVIALSTFSDKHFVLEMLKAGALGYVCKMDAGDAPAAIRSVMQGGRYFSHEIRFVLGEVFGLDRYCAPSIDTL